MRKLVAMLCVGVLLPLGSAWSQDDAVKKEREKLQGTWQVVSSEEDGRAMADVIVQNLKIVIKGDQINLSGVEELVNQFGKITMKVDPGTMPKTIDFKIVAGTEKDKTFEGIYVLKGDEL